MAASAWRELSTPRESSPAEKSAVPPTSAVLSVANNSSGLGSEVVAAAVEKEEGASGGGTSSGSASKAEVALPTETIKPTSGPTGLVGSVRYLSVAAHAGGRQTRRCDLESLAYVLIYLVRVRRGL